MNRNIYVSALKSSHHRTSLWIILFFIMVCIVFFQSIALISIDKNQQTIVLPAALDKPFSIQGDKASSSYIEQMSRYLSSLLLNYHPANAEVQFNTALKYVDPVSYGVIHNKYKNDLIRIKKNKLSSSFHIMKMNIFENNVIFEGEMIVVIGEKVVSKKMRAYEMDFSYKNRQFHMSKFQEIFTDDTPIPSSEGLLSDGDITLENTGYNS